MILPTIRTNPKVLSIHSFDKSERNSVYEASKEVTNEKSLRINTPRTVPLKNAISTFLV
ncbi:MAG: hypothetical protein NTZ60_08790 [Campylobacterales bacterium]|nr:hypothetical protein [Campylobacterales bacterium]